MSHEEKVQVIEPSNKAKEDPKTIEQQLKDANSVIDDLKLQIAWLERSYE